jgi:UDPglucose 6-dehydrogenase
MKVTIVGLGYVGLSLSILLAQKHDVIGYDINPDKVDKLNRKISPILDAEIIDYLRDKKLQLSFTTNPEIAFKDVDYLVVSTPTDFEEKQNSFNTSSIEQVIKIFLKFNKKATIIIKSTVPVGYTEALRKEFKYESIFFSPEFLREGKALYDNLYPSRIVIGSETPTGKKFGEMLQSVSLNSESKLFFTSSSEAEAIKLFSNTYLAMRVAYFNELDTFAELTHLNTKKIIEGVSSDPRIGHYYNNPSFGYGGYCLPKDAKQLLANFKNIPQELMSSVVESNRKRKDHIVDMILAKKPKVVGIYRLIMKSQSDNIRSSAIQGVIKRLSEKKVKVVIYEPLIEDHRYYDIEVVKDLSLFLKQTDLIVSNRFYNELENVKNKVYTRDLFNKD